MRRSLEPELQVSSSGQLRHEISVRNLALAGGLAHETTYGTVASVLYSEDEDGIHGNFYPPAYRRIVAHPGWARRLSKAYTASRRIARGHERRRSELDCANSSDALLMNVFCAPGVLRSKRLCSLLNVVPGQTPRFGVRVCTPLRGGHEDRTEADLQLGDLLLEAKLSEGDFQTARPELLHRYESFELLFDVGRLPRRRGQFPGYQLLRGAMAAHHLGCRYGVIADARRPDLREQFFEVLSPMNHYELRCRMLFITWQEIAGCLSKPLQHFLETKYGITATRER